MCNNKLPMRPHDKTLHRLICCCLNTEGRAVALEKYNIVSQAEINAFNKDERGKKVKGLLKSLDGRWVGFHIMEYTKHVYSLIELPEGDTEKHPLNLAMKNGVSDNLGYKWIWRIPTETVSDRKVELIFKALGEAQSKSQLEILLEFLMFCESKCYQLKEIFDDKSALDDAINDIKAYLAVNPSETSIQDDLVTNTSDETSQLTLQDIVTINGEIDKIRKDLDFYPYGKDKLYSNDPKKNETALIKIDQLLSASPNNVDLLALKSTLLSRLKKLDEAFKISEKLYRENSASLNASLSHIAILGKLKKHRKSLNIAREAQEIYPNSYPLSFNIGILLKFLGRYEGAIDELLRAVSLDKDCLMPYKILASIYTQLNQYQECESVLKAALRITPNNETILLELMRSLAIQGKNDEVMK